MFFFVFHMHMKVYTHYSTKIFIVALIISQFLQRDFSVFSEMGGFRDYGPTLAMFALQFTYSGVSLSTRAALLQGMSPRVFIVYRQAIATLVIAPIAYFSSGKSSYSMGLRSFCLIFLASLIGVTVNQNIFFEGLYLSSSSMASATGNLIPAITFVIATVVGLEKVDIRSLRSIAKILGTVFCVGGAIAMALLRGPKLLNAEFLQAKSFLFSSGGDNWFLGCLFLFASALCWSLWLILQVPVSASYPHHLSLSAWLCFFATIQSAILALFTDPDPASWNLSSNLELFCCFYQGVIGSGLAFCVQAWCISKRGPLFSAMFSPLGTVITTIVASLVLHEEIYTGSLIGAIGVILGLYVVLWGKANEHVGKEEETNPKQKDDDDRNVKIILIDHESSEKTTYQTDLEEPLLGDKATEDYANNGHQC
ncbi:WAT1-related protein [Melia azedarach]|uniref:WAT1-related protein n=1 Tax=Melia azedarach TaxID=155640 RepID=A0ACC1XF87_MELAZ|nr:WAT1-related protein [Melia azedarach]